jgi:hypothetical protein
MVVASAGASNAVKRENNPATLPSTAVPNLNAEESRQV